MLWPVPDLLPSLQLSNILLCRWTTLWLSLHPRMFCFSTVVTPAATNHCTKGPRALKGEGLYSLNAGTLRSWERECQPGPGPHFPDRRPELSRQAGRFCALCTPGSLAGRADLERDP